jgi:uncharacterized membrane protein
MAAARKQKRTLATMRMVYVDFWSALKLSFLVGFVVAVMTVVVMLLLWSLLDRVGLVATLRDFLQSIGGASSASVLANLTFSNVLTFTLVVALLELIVVSALGAIFAALFNLAARVVGGWRVTFGSD